MPALAGSRWRRMRWKACTLLGSTAVVGAFLLAVAHAAGSPPSSVPAAGAPDTDPRLAKVQERKRKLEHEVARLRTQEKGLLRDVEQLDLEVRLRGEDLREAELVLDRTNAQLDETLGRVRELTASLDRNRPIVAARARALYKMGRLSYLRLLLSIERPAAVIQGYRYVTALARRDNERIAVFRHDLNDLTATRAELTRRTEAVQARRADLRRSRRLLDAERKRKEHFLTEIVARKEVQADYLKELAEAEEKLQQMIAGLGDEAVSVPIVAFRGALPWPVKGRVRSTFGRHKSPRFNTYTVQNGIEIEAPLDTPVEVIHAGTVVFADRFLGYGLLVVVDHGNRHLSLYGRLGETRVKVGDKLADGDTVGTVGAGVDGPGLYFEIRSQGRPEDPMDWLEKRPL